MEIIEIDPSKNSFLAKVTGISSPPRSIFIKGTPPENKYSVAIVGTRKASAYGKNIALKLARDLAHKGISLISGLALGIDTCVHQGALEAGGITIAVLANGLDKIYPSENENLAGSIISSKGCLISEYPPKTPGLPAQFILRNRIISALSDAVIVVEAPKKSGALATAEFARKQGKKVFVVPGPVSTNSFFGSHQLLREGATLIRDTNDFFESSGFGKASQTKLKIVNLAGNERQVFDTLNECVSPASVDKICQMTKLSPREVNAILSSLIFKDSVTEDGGKYSVSGSINGK